MAEETIWTGTSSQIKNIGIFILCGITCILVVPIFIALWHYLVVRCKQYQLTTERLRIRDGVFSRKFEELELFRIKDITILQPFWHRIFGVENIRLLTSDHSAPLVVLDYMPQKYSLSDLIRKQVEIRRALKNVRELDVDGEHVLGPL